MYRVLLLLSVLAVACITAFRWMAKPYRHRRMSVEDLPQLLAGYSMQLGPGAQIHIDAPVRMGRSIVATVGQAGGSKTLRVGENEWLVSDPDTPATAARVIAVGLEGAGWHPDRNLTVWARGSFDPDYLRALYRDFESTSRLPRWMRNWVGRRREKV